MLDLELLFQKFDQYILKEFCLPLASASGIITGVWLGIDKFKEIFKLLAKSGNSIMTGIVILGLEIPQILAITLPVSILLASFLCFQKLSSQSEIIALRAAGLSFTKLMRPVLYLGLLGLLACFFLSEFIVPITNPFAKKIYILSLYKNPIAKDILNGYSYFEQDAKNTLRRIFYVRKVCKNQLKDVVILDFSQKGVTMMHTAKSGSWDSEQGGWLLESGTSSYIKASQDEKAEEDSGEMHLITNFAKVLIPSSINPYEIMKDLSNVRDMNIFALRSLIHKHESAHIYTDKLNEYKTKYLNKYAYPISCILLALIGACLGISARRRALNWGYILVALVVFVFFMSQTIFDSFGQSGSIEPLIAVFMPNIILSLMALLCFQYKSAN